MAAYVWSAYAIAIGGLVLNIWLARRQLRLAREARAAATCHAGVPMTPSQKRRLYMVLGILVGVGVAAAFALQAFKSGIGFKDPTAGGGRRRS